MAPQLVSRRNNLSKGIPPIYPTPLEALGKAVLSETSLDAKIRHYCKILIFSALNVPTTYQNQLEGASDCLEYPQVLPELIPSSPGESPSQLTLGQEQVRAVKDFSSQGVEDASSPSRVPFLGQLLPTRESRV